MDLIVKGISRPIYMVKSKSQSKSIHKMIGEADKQLKKPSSSASGAPIPINLSCLTSVYLDNQPKFQELKGHLKAFYEETSPEEMQKSLQWKSVLYRSLHRLLYECVITLSRRYQLECLEKAYSWFYKTSGKTREDPPKKVSVTKKKPEPLKRASTAPILKPRWLSLSGIPQQPVQGPILPFTGQGFGSSQQPETQLDPEIENKLNIKIFQSREKALRNKRVKKQMQISTLNWTQEKTRRCEERNRKSETNRFGFKSRPNTAAVPSKVPVYDVTEKPPPRCNTADIMHKKRRIEHLRKMQSTYLQLQSEDEDEDEDEPRRKGILSAYANVQDFSDTPSRPVTASMTQQIKEVYESKKTMARHKISCSIDVLKQALLIPSDLPQEFVKKVKLPSPGAGLLSNPLFFVDDSKKTRKQKRKR